MKEMIMRSRPYWLISASLFILGSSAAIAHAAASSSGDPGWPRVFKKSGKEVTVYQPQVDSWKDYTDIHYRAAIAVKTGSSKQEKYGIVEADARTVVDHDSRVVALAAWKRDLRFPNVSDSEAASLRKVVDELAPLGQATILSLDRVLACLNPEEHQVQPAVEVNIQPPKIFYSRKPALLVMFMGEPALQPVDPKRPELMFAINTNWDMFYDTIESRYYLLNGASWLSAADPVKGPWTSVKKLPAALSSLPADDNWAEVRKNVPGKPVKDVPVVFVTTEPAELILTKGEPSYSPIPGTRLMRVANTESVLFLHSGEGQYYFLTAGRWFRTKTLDGPWLAASADLPADFAKIPDDNASAFVKASVPGTRDAKDAVMLASVPTTTTITVAPVTEQVVYSGAPQFVVIQGTTVQYAVNSPNTVFLVDGRYYWCEQGVWLYATTASGPWTFCTSVPAAIYTIPPTHPTYNVTYVVVQSSTPTTVVYSQTSGYSGQYVAATGVLMFGMGVLVGAAIADDDHYHYYHYPPPCHYSYGCGAVYHHGHGGYYVSAHASYGPYGGAGRSAAYNPRTGTYSRGAYAYGPAGSASVRQAYNPYTGGYAQSGRVSTARGSAGGFYAEQGGKSAWGGYRSGPGGTVGGVGTSEGAGAVGWDTRYGQGMVAKDKEGNVYAGKDGTVYKKDDSGSWSSNSGSGWESVDRSQAGTPNATATSTSSRTQPSTTRTQPSATAQTQQPSGSREVSSTSRESTQSLNSQAQSRQWGNQQTQRTSQTKSSSSRSTRSPSGGGRR
jgi:hypothetical protein